MTPDPARFVASSLDEFRVPPPTVESLTAAIARAEADGDAEEVARLKAKRKAITDA